MDKLKAMTTFVAILDAGSLSAAADKMNRSPAAIVRTLANLEEYLGVRLLNRTTRRLSLTDEGTEYLHHCRRILAEIQAAEFRLDTRRTDPAGKITITAPVMFGQLHIAPLLNEWLKENSSMTAELILIDRFVDIIEEGFDLALRIGHLADSGLVARHVGSIPYIFCASPELIAKRGTPDHPEQLSDWPTIGFFQASDMWPFEIEGQIREQRIRPAMVTNQVSTVLTAARDGLGICRVLNYQAQEDLERGTLVPILTNYQTSPMPVQFVFPHSRLLSARVRHFLDSVAGPLKERIASLPRFQTK